MPYNQLLRNSVTDVFSLSAEDHQETPQLVLVGVVGEELGSSKCVSAQRGVPEKLLNHSTWVGFTVEVIHYSVLGQEIPSRVERTLSNSAVPSLGGHQV